MRIDLPKIYPITDAQLSELSHAEQVKQLIDGGATLIQLREKRAAPREFFRDAAEALRIAHAAGVKLIINDRVDIALALGADGIHLGQSDMPVDAARRLVGAKAIIGWSTHNLEQVNSALCLPIDYVAFGPVFGTVSKTNPDPVVGLNQLGTVKALVAPLPLVGIGGINVRNAASVIDAGADSVAVISALFSPKLKIPENLRNLNRAASNPKTNRD